MSKERLSKYNFIVTAILAAVVLGFLIFSSKKSADNAADDQALNQSSASSGAAKNKQPGVAPVGTLGENADAAARPFSLSDRVGASSSFSIPADLPEDMVRALNSPPPPLPPDIEAQLNAPPPELPEDLKRQLQGPQPPLPPEMQAQLNSPAPPLPEDIKRSLATPPRVVSIDEVNKPKPAENHENSAE